MKIVFAVVDGGGNIPPQLAVARALQARGVQIHVIGHRGIRQRVEAAGFAFEPFSEGRHFDPTARRSLPAIMADFTRVASDRRLGRSVVAAARRHHADAVVVDMILAAGMGRSWTQACPRSSSCTASIARFRTSRQARSAGGCGFVVSTRCWPNTEASCRSSPPALISTRHAERRASATPAWPGRASRAPPSPTRTASAGQLEHECFCGTTTNAAEHPRCGRPPTAGGDGDGGAGHRRCGTEGAAERLDTRLARP